MGLLEGKVALITGGARGQGRAHALAYAREGADVVADVVVADIAAQIGTVPYPMGTLEDVDETVRQVEALDRRAVAVQADVRSQEQLDAAVQRTLSEFGRLDLVAANAGIWTMSPFWELTEDQWEDMIGTNLTGVWKTAKAVAPHLIEQGSGSIVMTSSVAGHEGGTRDDLLAGGGSFHALRGAGMLDPVVIANAAVWLHSDLAARVTGVAIPVDAGHMLLPGVNPAPVA